jgi:hypothetical protein
MRELDVLYVRVNSTGMPAGNDRVGALASLSKRDNDVAERARAQPGELNHE